jgi:hypothetical protein
VLKEHTSAHCVTIKVDRAAARIWLLRMRDLGVREAWDGQFFSPRISYGCSEHTRLAKNT